MSADKTQEKKWQAIQDSLADNSGLAVVIADEDSPELVKSNNNSICQVLYGSDEFAPECAKFCGKAFEMATKAGAAVEYKCYAGLNCIAVPIQAAAKPLVAIVGRAFLKAEDYRNATERAISGEWRKFPPTKFFENVLLTGSAQNLESLAKKVERASREIKENHTQQEVKKSKTPRADESERLAEEPEFDVESAKISSEPLTVQRTEEARKIGEWRSLLGSLLDLSYPQACESITQFVARRYAFSSVAWLERRKNQLEAVFAIGQLEARQMQVSISADDARLLDAVKNGNPLELREREDAEKSSEAQTIYLFPILISGAVRSAIIVADEIANDTKKRHIARFCRTISAQLEVLRLREEIDRRDWLKRAMLKFNESVKEIDTEDFWSSLAQISAELMQAERVSLLAFDEKSNSWSVKAATGAQADIIKSETDNIGARIAQRVLQTGEPLIVENIRETGISAAPVEWNYQSNSFISYPITIGRRKIGVLNIADRADRKSFNEFDLEILNAIMPQLAVAIDRALLKHKAGEFEQLSVTDSMTGLLNRLYLDERLPEEIRRSNREGFSMSFMMIDVDDFKSYNDSFGHLEGDKALKIVALCLKEGLRGADVAVRYGGEEFSILLPQTTLDEAAIIGERIREKIASSVFPNRSVTISIGIASCSSLVCTADEIKKRADDALYEAKRRGRNNVQIYENPE